MKSKKFLVTLVALVLCLFTALTGCGSDKKEGEDNQDPPAPAETTVTLTPVEATVIEGEEITLTAEVTGQDAELVWSSSKKLVASVTGSGKTAVVKANSVGSATIRVKVDGELKATCEITVIPEPEKLSINLPMKKLVLRQAGDMATVTAKILDPAVDAATVKWAVADKKIATIETQGLIAAVKAGDQGVTELSVTAKAGTETVTSVCEIVVLEAYEDMTTHSYVVHKADGTAGETFVGLANAVGTLANDAAYGEGSYLTDELDPDTIVYTYNKKNYSFFTRGGVYHGFDANSHVTDGQANWWQDFYKTEHLDLFANEKVNMLQHNGTVQNTWYHRRSTIIHREGDVNIGWQGYRDTVYTAAGAGANYATYSDSKAYDMTDVELSYDLTGYMVPSKSHQPVFAELYIRPMVNHSDAKNQKYYGAYFDAGTAAEAATRADGEKRAWYGYEGNMFYYKTDGIVYPNQSQLTIKTDTPIGYSTWNASEGRWETDLKIKLAMTYHFSDENGGNNFTIDYAVSGTQDGQTRTANFTYELGAVFNRGAVRLSYGVAFTPKAAISDTEQWEGFYKNTEVPDIYNGGSWTGVKQTKAVYNKKDGGEGSLAFIGTGTRQFVSIWGNDVCSYKNDTATSATTFGFQF